jgi:hypothetical protein
VRPIPSWLTVAIEAPAKATKTAIMIAAAPVITRAVRSRPKSIAAALSPWRVVVLPHPHQEEDRVVDREAEDDAEDRRRADRVDVVRPPRGQSSGRLKSKVRTPKATATVARLRPTAIAASGSARRTRTRTRKVARVIAITTKGIRDLVTWL